jgi:hypothetical protein
MRKFVILTAHITYYGDNIKKNDICRTCDTREGNEKCMRDFYWEIWIVESDYET